MIVRKSPAELEVMARAGAVVAAVHEVLHEALRPGMTTSDLDELAEAEIKSRGATPSFKGYHGFPATLCTSVNSQVVHGIPSPRVTLATGDVIKIDAGAVVDGYHADSAVTWIVGDEPVEPDVTRLIQGTRVALWDAIHQTRPGNRLGDVSSAVEVRGRAGGHGVVRGYGGHGIGRALHEDPPVPNVGRAGRGTRLTPGLVIAVEPMFTLGSGEVVVLDDRWTVVTADGAPSAHWEHTIAVTEDGPWVLTARSDEPSRPAAGWQPPVPVDVSGGG